MLALSELRWKSYSSLILCLPLLSNDAKGISSSSELSSRIKCPFAVTVSLCQFPVSPHLIRTRTPTDLRHPPITFSSFADATLLVPSFHWANISILEFRWNSMTKLNPRKGAVQKLRTVCSCDILAEPFKLARTIPSHSMICYDAIRPSVKFNNWTQTHKNAFKCIG